MNVKAKHNREHGEQQPQERGENISLPLETGSMMFILFWCGQLSPPHPNNCTGTARPVGVKKGVTKVFAYTCFFSIGTHLDLVNWSAPLLSVCSVASGTL